MQHSVAIDITKGTELASCLSDVVAEIHGAHLDSHKHGRLVGCTLKDLRVIHQQVCQLETELLGLDFGGGQHDMEGIVAVTVVAAEHAFDGRKRDVGDHLSDRVVVTKISIVVKEVVVGVIIRDGVQRNLALGEDLMNFLGSDGLVFRDQIPSQQGAGIGFVLLDEPDAEVQLVQLGHITEDGERMRDVISNLQVSTGLD